MDVIERLRTNIIVKAFVNIFVNIFVNCVTNESTLVEGYDQVSPRYYRYQFPSFSV